MKKIIPLFTFTFGLHLLLAAGSVSSAKVDNFMQLPAWMPSAVSAEDTFGSPDRTNASHRVTENTLAAEAAAFDALYERAFFSSEGRTNGWDEAEYGPREPCAEMMTNNVRMLFQYESWNTNGVPLVAPDTRRLVDFANIGKFYDEAYLRAVYLNTTGRTLLDRGEFWDSYDRNVMFACSKTPGEEPPLKYEQWTAEGPEEMRYGKCFLPLASFELGKMDPDNNYSTLDAHEYPSWVFCGLFMFDESESDAATGDKPPLHFLDELFGYALGCPTNLVYDALYTPHSRRLLPDEYVNVDTSTDLEYIYDTFFPSTESTRSLVREWKPWIGCELRPGSSNQGWGMVVVPDDGIWLDLRSWSGTLLFDFEAIWTIYGPVKPYPNILYGAFDFDPPSAKEVGADYLHVVGGGDPIFTVSINDDRVVTGGEWWYVDDNFGIWAELYRDVLVTNSVTTNVSVLATIGRELAVMDRTYEVMRFKLGKPDPADEDTILRVIRTEASGTGGKLQGPDSWVSGKFEVSSYDPFQVVFRPNNADVYLLPPTIKTNEMAISISVTTNGYVDTKRDRIRFHGADLSSPDWGFEGGTGYWHWEEGPIDFDIEHDLPDGFHPVNATFRQRNEIATLSLSLSGKYIGTCTMDLSELDGVELPVPMHTLLYVDGSYSFDATEKFTDAKAKRLYAFAGPTDRAFETKRVRDDKYFSYGGMGYIEDFSLLRNGTMVDGRINLDIGYISELAHMELRYQTIFDDMRRQRTHYRSSPIDEQLSADTVYGRIVGDRISARDAAFGSVSQRIGADINDPREVLDFEHAADLTETHVELMGEVDAELSFDKGVDGYLANVKDRKITAIYGYSTDAAGHMQTNQLATVGLSAIVKIDARNLIYTYANPPKLRETPPYPGRDPAHADAKSARIVWTDWDWKALKMSTENQ